MKHGTWTALMVAVLAASVVLGMTGCGTIGTMGQKFGFGEDLLKTTVLVVAQREGVDLNADDVDTVTELLRNSIKLQTELDAIAQRNQNQKLLEQQIAKYLVDGQLVLDGNIYDPGSTTPVATVYAPQPGDVDTGLWKPISENDQKLVILLPASLDASGVTVSGNGRTDTGSYGGVHNGGRQHWRFPVPGADYGTNATVAATMTIGADRTWTIADGAKRDKFTP